jgi:hypothetical protein
MTTRFTRSSVRRIVIMLAFVLSLLASSLTAFGAVKYTFVDRKLSVEATSSGNIRVNGDRIVYIDKDKAGAPQVYLKSYKTGKVEQVTNDLKFKTSLQLVGDDIYYTESVKNYTEKVNVFQKNIIRYNLKTKARTELLEKPWYPSGLLVDGNYAVYSDSGTNIIDLKTLKVTELPQSQGVPRALVKGKLLMVAGQSSNGELVLYDLKTGTKKSLYKTKDNQSLYDADFNGTHAVWLTHTKSMGADGKYKYQDTYTIADLTQSKVKYKYISIPVTLDRYPIVLDLGTNYLAYTEKKNDNFIVRGYDLTKGGTFTYGTWDNKAFTTIEYFEGDELLMRDNKGKTFLRGVSAK